jgi:uncharacterized repeat protein (TIGR02543 family)
MKLYKSKFLLAACAFAALAMAVPGAALALTGDGTESSPYAVATGKDLDEALTVIGEDYYRNSDGQNVSDMHYISLTNDIDAVASATYGNEDEDHPVRVTIEGNGHEIDGTLLLPSEPPTHAGGNKYTGLRLANRTPFTEFGRGNHIVLKNLTVRGLYNAETHGGGAFAIFGGKVEVEGCVFDGNVAFGTTRGGGAILLQHRASLLSVKNSTFVNNTSVAPGGAIDSSGDQDNAEIPGENVMIENSTFYGNKSTREDSLTGGGGAIAYSRALGRITNCTVVGNEAANHKGEGVYARYNISGNPSGLGAKSNIGLFNSIVAGNGSGTDVDRSNPASATSCDVSGSYNVAGTLGEGVLSGGNSSIGMDVSMFLEAGAPKVNVQGTPTIALLDTADSPAIDKADPYRAPATDQRGFPRAGAADIGAYEFAVEPITYKVTFDSQGGSEVAPMENVPHGTMIPAPESPTKAGNSFAGWYWDAAGTTAWDFDNDAVTEDITLYAKWVPAGGSTYTVTFNSQGGSSVQDITGVEPGAKIEPPKPDPTKEGYVFGGWYKDIDGKTAWDFANDVVTQDTVLYAKWTRRTSNVGGGSGGCSAGAGIAALIAAGAAMLAARCRKA